MAKGMFTRMTDILRSNINEALDRAEDPEKLLRQMIREMEEAVNKATASVGTAVANQKRLERQRDERVTQTQDWQRKAERAVEKGEDELARRALERKTVLQRAVHPLDTTLGLRTFGTRQLHTQLRHRPAELSHRTLAGADFLLVSRFGVHPVDAVPIRVQLCGQTMRPRPLLQNRHCRQRRLALEKPRHRQARRVVDHHHQHARPTETLKPVVMRTVHLNQLPQAGPTFTTATLGRRLATTMSQPRRCQPPT